ncbi:hypothetical protein LC087_00725 [Bacillus carboniphilus]|uniref:ATP-grasp domain-containing protein n=1 Tax=Bacillus carboniphilus TaxID=86663 RepID=A0ABY9JTS0_9BACI|nr:YheC/YheD family protein [Bacillus carboniphilus]WLR42801.1 hypothetical protein LC087_00725 [Bacillus carboniphilus]
MDVDQLHDLVNEIGHCLSSQLGKVGEFSLDLGITEEDQFVLFEINSKPMKFDEKPIEKARINALAELFLSYL